MTPPTRTQAKDRTLGDEEKAQDESSSKKGKRKHRLPDREHARGCPVLDPDSPIGHEREESYVVTAPPIRDGDSIVVPQRKVRTTRCGECGGHLVTDPKRERYFRERDSEEDDEEV